MWIRIKDLRLRAIIGIEEWERKNKQDLIINVELEFDGAAAARSDSIDDSVNYKSITKAIIREVEGSSHQLLERLADRILQIVMEDERVIRSVVEVDKPHALRFADSVSMTVTGERAP